MKGKLVRPAVVTVAIVGALVAGGIAYATVDSEVDFNSLVATKVDAVN